MSRLVLNSLPAILVGIIGVAPASAQIVAVGSTDFTVSASMNVECTIEIAPLDFETILPVISNNVDVSTSGTVACTAPGAVKIFLDAGTNGGSAEGRVLVNDDASASILYDLFIDPARSMPFGIYPDFPTGLEVNVSVVGGVGVAEEFSIHGRIFSGQTIQETLTAFSSVVTATVAF